MGSIQNGMLGGEKDCIKSKPRVREITVRGTEIKNTSPGDLRRGTEIKNTSPGDLRRGTVIKN